LQRVACLAAVRMDRNRLYFNRMCQAIGSRDVSARASPIRG
jgi:hypothetical protein